MGRGKFIKWKSSKSYPVKFVHTELMIGCVPTNNICRLKNTIRSRSGARLMMNIKQGLSPIHLGINAPDRKKVVLKCVVFVAISWGEKMTTCPIDGSDLDECQYCNKKIVCFIHHKPNSRLAHLEKVISEIKSLAEEGLMAGSIISIETIFQDIVEKCEEVGWCRKNSLYLGLSCFCYLA